MKLLAQKISPEKAGRWFLAILLVVLTAAPYLQMESHQFINWDDPYYISNNPMVSAGLSWLGVGWAFITGTASNWHPLTWLSHMLDSSLFGPTPKAAHLVNLAWYIGCVLLVFRLGMRLNASPAVAFLMAAFFGLHPLHVESVAWAAERKDVLCAFFFLAATIAYLDYKSRQSLVQYLLVTFLFILSLLSKPMAVTWPFVALLLDYWPLKRIHEPVHAIYEKIPWFILAMISSVITLIVQAKSEAIKSVIDFPIPNRMANAVLSYFEYVKQSLWPFDLTVFYPYPYAINTVGTIIACLTLLGITALVLWQWHQRPYLLWGWMFYLGVLVPVIGLIQVGAQAHADRYTLLPQIGLIIAVGLFLDQMLTAQNVRRLVAAIMVLIIATLGGLTFRQVSFWKDSKTLFYQNLDVAGENEMAHFNLGVAYLRDKQLALAVTHFSAAAKMNPDEATTFNNLGDAYAGLQQTSLAEQCFRRAIALNPRLAQPHFHLAALKFRQGHIREAAKHIDEAVRLAPEWKEVRDLRYRINACFSSGTN